jgi:hypothetical protein
VIRLASLARSHGDPCINVLLGISADRRGMGRRRSSGIDLPLLCSNITIYLTGIEANGKVARASACSRFRALS